MTRHVTLADVARRAGVSKASASLAMNERPGSRLAPETVQRVQEAARELDYRPNPAARHLRLGTTRTVGLISDDVIVTRFASAMIAGALTIGDATDHTILISETSGAPERMTRAIEAMLDRRADGVIFALMAAKLVELPPLPDRLRVVILNGTGSRAEPSVLPAEYAAGQAIAEELLRAGHRDVAVIGHARPHELPPTRSVTIGTRLSGIRTAFERAGVRPVLQLDDLVWEPARGYELTRQVLGSGRRVTALLCLNDRLAFGAYQALQEAGLRVPDDMSVASFDDDEIARYLRPGLTTASIPYETMGRRAMTLLLGGDEPEAPVLVDMPVQRRGSVAAPRSS